MYDTQVIADSLDGAEHGVEVVAQVAFVVVLHLAAHAGDLAEHFALTASRAARGDPCANPAADSYDASSGQSEPGAGVEADTHD